MSVTVADLLRLPSLRGAEVVAGHGGLQKIVASISVLEAIDPGMLNDNLFNNDEFYGSEIVITGFLNATEDYRLQCDNVRRLAEGGEVGLILYYVGVYLKEIHPSLTALADELDFPLICMPKNRVDLRYSEVISDVTRAIVRDQMSGASMVAELLERVTRLPKHQQTVDTVVKMLSDRLRATVILTDSHLRVLNEAAWPRALAGLHAHLRFAELPARSGEAASFPPVTGGLIYRERIQTDNSSGMELFLVRDGEPLSRAEVQQAGESVQLAVQLWSQQHERMAVAELVKAIMQDEPLKMRRLADIFKIDIGSVHVMWVFTGAEFSNAHAYAVAECAARLCKTAFCHLYDKSLTLFMDGPASAADAENLCACVDAALPEGTRISMFFALANTTEAREAFLSNREYLPDAMRILPGCTRFDGDDIAFARACRNRIQAGEAAVREALMPLRALSGRRDGEEWIRTLTVYLLDANMRVPKTADLLYVHKNTVKYRLGCMADCFGFPVGRMPATLRLYEAVAIKRLMEAE